MLLDDSGLYCATICCLSFSFAETNVCQLPGTSIADKKILPTNPHFTKTFSFARNYLKTREILKSQES